MLQVHVQTEPGVLVMEGCTLSHDVGTLQHYGALLLDCIAKERLQLLPLFMHLEQVS